MKQAGEGSRACFFAKFVRRPKVDSASEGVFSAISNFLESLKSLVLSEKNRLFSSAVITGNHKLKLGDYRLDLKWHKGKRHIFKYI
ncbi:hypothetical protein J2S04_001909 [Alicyclobacillus tengchongensis]|uniref:Uncharacterized protein n=1 Tax=Alicyclobacillus tolerans TaxID=90970 RepID=A0ABT9LXG1_9BACL|nr:hypothetical protein [Alicyclobacillus tengchongensis]